MYSIRIEHSIVSSENKNIPKVSYDIKSIKVADHEPVYMWFDEDDQIYFSDEKYINVFYYLTNLWTEYDEKLFDFDKSGIVYLHISDTYEMYKIINILVKI